MGHLIKVFDYVLIAAGAFFLAIAYVGVFVKEGLSGLKEDLEPVQCGKPDCSRRGFHTLRGNDVAWRNGSHLARGRRG